MITKKRKTNIYLKDYCFTAISFFIIVSTLLFSVYCFEISKNSEKTDSFFAKALAIENVEANESVKTAQQIINNISEQDRVLLAKTVCGETGLLKSISDTERRWIVWTILNRVKSNYSSFASQSTIFEVITRKNQFTPINSNGDLIKQVDRKIFEENKEYFLSIVETCMYMEKETDSLYYCNYKIIDNNNKKWFDTLSKISTSNGFVHSFYTP